jgi:hypothetical protein
MFTVFLTRYLLAYLIDMIEGFQIVRNKIYHNDADPNADLYTPAKTTQ